MSNLQERMFALLKGDFAKVVPMGIEPSHGFGNAVFQSMCGAEPKRLSRTRNISRTVGWKHLASATFAVGV